MGRELINRITRKKDGIYISTHSSNDNAPYHSVKIDFLTDVYNKEGQKGLDREIISMLFNYAELRGSHQSLQRYLYAYNSKYAENIYKEYMDKINYYYEKLNDMDKKSLWSCNKTKNAENYNLQKNTLEKEMYNKIAKKCDEYDLINSIVMDSQNDKSFFYYEDVVNKILDISNEYDIDFDSHCPFDFFGSDDESKNFGMYSFSKYYEKILEKIDINNINILTENLSDGKYKLIINNEEYKLTAWDNLESVIKNVDLITQKIRENKLKRYYDQCEKMNDIFCDYMGKNGLSLFSFNDDTLGYGVDASKEDKFSPLFELSHWYNEHSITVKDRNGNSLIPFGEVAVYSLTVTDNMEEKELLDKFKKMLEDIYSIYGKYDKNNRLDFENSDMDTEYREYNDEYEDEICK